MSRRPDDLSPWLLPLVFAVCVGLCALSAFARGL